jgi:replicative DNA helicase
MNYIYLIKKLFSFDLYNKYRHYIKVTRDQKEIYYLFKALDGIFKQVQHDITFEDYALWVGVNLGKDYDTFLSLILNTNASEDILIETLKKIKEQTIAYEIAGLALEVSEGKKDISCIKEALSSLEDNIIEEEQFVTSNILHIYEKRNKDKGLRWRLNALNQSLGSLRKGNFGFLFARPETGKTTFLASECTHFITQTERPILWFNNEEDGEAVQTRIFQAFFGITEKTLSSNLEEYNRIYNEIVGDRLKIRDSASIHKTEVLRLTQKLEPALIIFDQLDKIKGFHNDREDLRLGEIYIWARELAKEFCPVIGVSQSDASGEGKKYLNMDNVANAKTAKQAEADWILGIGKSNDNGFELIRHFNISKNKLIGDEDTLPMLRHGKFDVLIQPEIARFRDI